MPKRLIDNYFPADYEDTYSRELHCRNAITPEELFNSMMVDLPKWVDKLMKLRSILVRPLGLKSDGFKEYLPKMIQCRNDNEIVWGMNDKHLLFYASMWCGEKYDDKQIIGMTTIVKYNNVLGRVYFFFIRPFHKLIIKSQLHRI